jgi:mannose/fructose/N-acetylgalactosamine-specific phosphotransferase system component IIB
MQISNIVLGLNEKEHFIHAFESICRRHLLCLAIMAKAQTKTTPQHRVRLTKDEVKSFTAFSKRKAKTHTKSISNENPKILKCLMKQIFRGLKRMSKFFMPHAINAYQFLSAYHRR